MKKLIANLKNDYQDYFNSLSQDDFNYLLTLNPYKLQGGRNITGIKNELMIKNFTIVGPLDKWFESHIDLLNKNFQYNNIVYCTVDNINFFLEKKKNDIINKNNYKTILKITITRND